MISRSSDCDPDIQRLLPGNAESTPILL
ncbi:hypothetical protein TIFTF001_039072 [Ficus carica]|uniref:Uncharacterized protein n=1 Tax=Ficus carica TaxID=3494 RepID=A0AA88JDQ3_FICCA|nr:hypothetical protein TIFTF001_039072 [Ficus carica]